mgnify:CR=1 FL=1
MKTEIATLLTNEVVSESVKGFVADKEYLNKFIVSLAAQWSANESIVSLPQMPKDLRNILQRTQKLCWIKE